MEEKEPGVLGVEYAGEEGYAAVVVLQVEGERVGRELGGLIEGVRGLMGEVGFEGMELLKTESGEGRYEGKEGR